MHSRRVLAAVVGGAFAAITCVGTQSVAYAQSNSNTNPEPQPPSLIDRAKRLLGTSLPLLGTDSGKDEKPVATIKPWDWNWDGRHSIIDLNLSSASGDDVKSMPKPRSTRHLIFVRHGQYHMESDDEDCHLTERGREQLYYTGMRLKQLQFPYKILRYSTMTRAIESAEQILNHFDSLPAEPTALLREAAPYQLEPPLPHYRPTAADLEQGKHIEAAFKKFVHRADPTQTEDSFEIFVCHANVIRYIVCRALQLPPEAWIRFSLDHGSITWIVVRPDGRVALRCLGNSGHLPPEKITI